VLTLFLSACLPTLRLLLVKLFPILGGSSARSRQYYNYGSGNELKNVSQKQRSYNVNTAVSSPQNESFDDKVEAGIRVHTSYNVKHSHSRGDTDEASLVSHEGPQRL
jgi:hypothetical protein